MVSDTLPGLNWYNPVVLGFCELQRTELPEDKSQPEMNWTLAVATVCDAIRLDVVAWKPYFLVN